MLHHSSFVLRNLRKPHLAQTTLATTELYLLRRVTQAIIGAVVIAVPLALLTWVDHSTWVASKYVGRRNIRSTMSA